MPTGKEPASADVGVGRSARSTDVARIGPASPDANARPTPRATHSVSPDGSTRSLTAQTYRSLLTRSPCSIVQVTEQNRRIMEPVETDRNSIRGCVRAPHPPPPRRAPTPVPGPANGMNGCSVRVNRVLNKGLSGAFVSLDGMEDRSFPLPAVSQIWVSGPPPLNPPITP